VASHPQLPVGSGGDHVRIGGRAARQIELGDQASRVIRSTAEALPFVPTLPTHRFHRACDDLSEVPATETVLGTVPSD